MWMSLARSFAARKSSELTSRMIGASSSVSRRSCGSSSSWARLVEVLGLHLAHQLLGLVQRPVVDPVDGVDDRRRQRDPRARRCAAAASGRGRAPWCPAGRPPPARPPRPSIARGRISACLAKLIGTCLHQLGVDRRPARCGRGRAGRAAPPAPGPRPPRSPPSGRPGSRPGARPSRPGRASASSSVVLGQPGQCPEDLAQRAADQGGGGGGLGRADVCRLAHRLR